MRTPGWRRPGYMRRLVGGWLLVSAFAASPAAGDGEIAAVPDEVVVRFTTGADAHDRREARRRVDATLEAQLAPPRTQLLRLEPGADVAEAVALLERTQGVRIAEPNLRRMVNATVDDPFFDYLWGLRNAGQLIQGRAGTPGADIRGPLAWDLATGSPELPVAVIDTGVDTRHPDLAPRQWRNPGEIGGNRRDDDGNGYVDDIAGWDWVADDADPDDENGHGTHVAGTIAATGNDHTGVVGVAPTSSIMALRILGADGSGTLADLLDAYEYAVRNGARVVNLSLGGGQRSRLERDVLAAADRVLFVAAAGNGGADGLGDDNDATGEYPCAYELENVICVAASDRDDALAAFSNYGRTSVDLAAPGVGIMSDRPTRSGEAQYGFASGTSMATPHVAGAAALVGAAAVDAGALEWRRALLDSVSPVPPLIGRVATGGRLDARRALDAVGQSGQPPPTPTPTPIPTPGPSSPAPTPAPAPGPPPPAPAPGAPPTGPAVSDNDPPLASLMAPARVPSGRFRARGLRVRVGCSEPCRLTATLVRGSRRIGRAGAALHTAGQRTVRLRPTRAARRMRLRGPARLTVRYRDLASNRRVLHRRVTLVR
jgi:thermitase